MSHAFRPATLGKFEDAAASIPLRQLVRVFETLGIRLGDDPGGIDGARRVQFRRYVASVDQSDLIQRDRLGDALGALLEEVATSKIAFLVDAARTDGFALTHGVFRPVRTTADAFAIASVDQFSLVDERIARLTVLANDRPAGAVAGARQLVETLCRTLLRALAAPVPSSTVKLDVLAHGTLDALARKSPDVDVVRDYLEQCAAVVATLDKRRNVASHHALLAIDATRSFAAFVMRSYETRTDQPNARDSPGQSNASPGLRSKSPAKPSGSA